MILEILKLYGYCVSGCTDYFAKDESEALELGRDIISTLNRSMNDRLSSTSEDPLYDRHELKNLLINNYYVHV
jgi:acetyl-CoA carboxylase carboxyltransferase component